MAFFLVALAANGLDYVFLRDQVVGTRNSGPTGTIAGLLVLAPTLAVTARRLHDIDKSEWWFFLYCLPVVGWLVLLFWLIRDSHRGTNRFGRDPKALPQPDGIQDYVPPRAGSAR